MEEAQNVGHYMGKRPWHQTGWGEAILVILGLIIVGVFVFTAAVAMEVHRLTQTRNVNDISGEGAISVDAKAKPTVDGTAPAAVVNESMSLGSPKAELTIVEFADFGCPYSAEASHTMRELAAKYPTRFHYVYRDFPNTDLHPDAENSALAARCAAEQGKFWAYHDKLFANQGSHDAGSLVQYASETGMNVTQFTSCVGTRKYAKEVQADFEAGVAAGIQGTPTFFLNGHKAEGALPADQLEALLLKFPETQL